MQWTYVDFRCGHSHTISSRLPAASFQSVRTRRNADKFNLSNAQSDHKEPLHEATAGRHTQNTGIQSLQAWHVMFVTFFESGALCRQAPWRSVMYMCAWRWDFHTDTFKEKTSLLGKNPVVSYLEIEAEVTMMLNSNLMLVILAVHFLWRKRDL